MPVQRRQFREALTYAWDGFHYVCQTQGNMRIHFGFGLLVIAAARWLRFDEVRLALVVMMVGIVIGAEWLNTAIERTVDLVTTEQHPLARLAKDLAAGAVLWFGLIALTVGALLFAPYLPHLSDFPRILLQGPPLQVLEVGLTAAAAAALIFSGLRR